MWTAGNAATRWWRGDDTDLPVDARGYVLTRADLRVGTADEIVPDAWAAGDDAAIPDLAVGGGTLTVPNAQHAVRQAKRLAANIVADPAREEPKPYVHHNLGVVATLGRGSSASSSCRRLVITGWPAWAMHRGYHLLAVPSWERKLRVLLGWVAALVGRRDVASLAAATTPRQGFEDSRGTVGRLFARCPPIRRNGTRR